MSENVRLNALRAGAAISVATGHARTLMFPDYSEARGALSPAVRFLYAVTGMGFSSVIIFFVLSGYWIGGGLLAKIQSGRLSISSYLIARFTRLYVVLLPALILTALADSIGKRFKPTSLVYLGGPEFHSMLPGVGALTSSVRVMATNAVFMQGLLSPSYGTNTPLWSLAVEFWYYILALLIVLVFAKIFTQSRSWIEVTCSSGLALAVALLLGERFVLLFGAWLLGAAVAELHRRKGGFRWRLRNSVSLATFCVLIGVLFGAQLLHWSDNEIAGPVAIAAACVISVEGANELHLTALPRWWHRVVNSLAACSFSLYATHLPVMAMAVALFGYVRIMDPNKAHAWFICLAAIVSSILIAYLFAFATERHTHAIRRLVVARIGAGRRT